ncbi:MAG: reverse transcriptase family protein [Parvibaculum sp.]|nr:reverse transcriptase family protein [Parvibaculum sp.]
MTNGRPKNQKKSDNYLFAIDSKKDLARRLSTKHFSISEDELDALAGDTGNFKLFPKTIKGKVREIQEPKRALQRLHVRVHKILSRLEAPEYLHSTVRGRSYLSNASAHRGDVPVVKIDVKKYFASVPRVAVFKFFLEVMRCRRDVAGLLANMLTFDKHLATGSSASPILAYYVFQGMFDEIEKLATSKGLTMTCYVDDITLSGAGANRGVLNDVRKIIARYGLRSHKMCKFEAMQPKVITGVCNSSTGKRVPNSLHLKIADGFKELKELRAYENAETVLKPLLGRLEAAGQIDPAFRDQARTLRTQFKAGSWVF